MPGNTSFFSFFVVVVCSCTVNFIQMFTAWYLINRLLIWMFENILLEWRQILPRRWKLKPFQTWQRLSRKLRRTCQTRQYQQELHVTGWKIQSFMRYQMPVLLMDEDKTYSKIWSSLGEISFLKSIEEECWNPKICIFCIHA